MRRETTMLDELLVDEYYRCKKNANIWRRHIEEEGIKGCICHKTIRGKIYLYHQWREDGKTVSRCISEDQAKIIENRLNLQKEWKRTYFLTKYYC